MSVKGLTLKNVRITFEQNEQKHLKVTIKTPHLLFRSVISQDVDNYATLFGDKEVMVKFADGTTRTREQIEKRINDTWVKRWKENDPYAGLAIFEKETGEFVGHGVLGHGDVPGESEAAIIIMKKFWNKGYASEASLAALRYYVPKLVSKGYQVDGKPLEIIRATARPDNPASCKIMEKAGMVHERDEEKYGAIRRHYSLHTSALKAPKKRSRQDVALTKAAFIADAGMKLRSKNTYPYRNLSHLRYTIRH